MAKDHSKTLLAFGDVHIPHQNPRAVEVFCRAAERIRPDLELADGDVQIGTNDLLQDPVGALQVDEEMIVREEEAADVMISDDALQMVQHRLRLHGPPFPLVHDRIPAETATEGAAAA